MKAPIQLAPFQHELNGRGTKCSSQCPACRWRREQLAAELVTPFARLKPEWLNCELFQIGLEELGLFAR